MSLIILYPWLKALHVAAALLFVGGVISTYVFLKTVAGSSSVLPLTVLAVQRWDRMVTTPAMLLVWGFGLALALSGNWTGSGWLPAKILFVVFLSAVHGVQSGSLRRSTGASALPIWRRGSTIVTSVIAIAILAVVKPF